MSLGHALRAHLAEPDGDAARGMVLGELTMEIGHPDALARMIAVSTTLT